MLETLVLIALGAHRLWLLWHQSELFRPVRERAAKIPGRIGYLAECSMCTASWAGFIMTGLWQFPPLDLIVWGMAAISVVGIVDTANAILTRKAMGH